MKDRRQVLFCLIPLVLGIQQLTEGILWVVLKNDTLMEWRQLLLVIASLCRLVWPLLIPFAVLLMEKDTIRRQILYCFCAIGILVFSYLLNNLLFHPVYAHMNRHYVDFELDFPHWHNEWVSAILYMMPTLGSLFVSNIKKANVPGAVTICFLLITRIFYAAYLFSGWCLFSVIIGLIVYLVIADEQSMPHVMFSQPAYH